jgi:uridine kinase
LIERAQSRVFSLIEAWISEKRDCLRPFVVGVSGIDAAGKSRFAEALRAHLTSNFPVQIIHLDAFHNSRAIRYAGDDEVENYLSRSINFELFEQKILRPLKDQGRCLFDERLLDLDTDQYSRCVKYEITAGDIVIIEGVFLFRKPWRRYLDLRVFLRVAQNIARERGVSRDARTLGVDVRRRYERKYLPAQAIHCATDEPEEHAHIVIDNNDFMRPVILRPESIG